MEKRTALLTSTWIISWSGIENVGVYLKESELLNYYYYSFHHNINNVVFMWAIGIKLLVYSAMLVGMVVVLHPTSLWLNGGQWWILMEINSTYDIFHHLITHFVSSFKFTALFNAAKHICCKNSMEKEHDPNTVRNSRC